MRLVRFLSLSGICSRREAVEIIKNGFVCVNATPCDNPAYLVQTGDVVTCNGKTVTPPSTHTYLMLNKPAGVISASSSPYGEMTVVEWVQKEYADQRLFPIGRLDKETTGLIVLTNDGDLTFKLSHPKFEVQKKYLVMLDRALYPEDQELLLEGVDLEDGRSAFDTVIPSEMNPRIIEVSLHSGKNRIIKRMFSCLDYNVVKLHREAIGKLTLGTLRVGDFRKLSELDIKKMYEND